jgi:signal transduction histidine kinase
MSLNRPKFFDRFWAIAGAVSVRTKILGIVLGLVVLLGVGITIQVRAVLSATLTAQLQEQSVSAARDLAARATDLLLLNDLYALHRLLQETQRNNANVSYAFILDTNGNVAAHTFGDQFPLDLLALNAAAPSDHHHTVILETNEGLVWDTAVPVLDGRAGTARVGLSDAGVRQAVQAITGQLILTTILVSLVGMTAATFLTWILTRPILSLVSATKAVAAGDFSPQVRRWADDEIGDLADAFNQMTGELARMDDLRREREALRRQLLERVITTQEEERKRIARELHDSTSQTLTSLMVGLRVMENTCPDCQIQEQARELRDVAAQTLDEVHALAMQLRPRLLDDLGLPAALQRLAEEWQARHKIPADLLIHIGEVRLPGPVETALYRIVQEALTNAARHAQASAVSVLVERRGEQIIVVVEDDGIGFDATAASGDQHLGLMGITERAELLGGKLTIESTPGRGTSVFVEIPLVRDSIL